jgi:hypothetical protein
MSPADSPVSALSPASEVNFGRRSKSPGPAWAYAYLAVQILCQLALLSSTLAPSRVFFRSAAFLLSVAFLVVIPGASKKDLLARTLATIVMFIVTLSALNPAGGAVLAVIAHWAFYLAIIAPLFWVARLELEPKVLPRLLLVLWAFHTASSIAGLLQLYFPGQFQPALTVFIHEKQALMIRLASGEWVPRPMGLSDTPGGVASSGVYACLFGLAVVLTRPFRYARVIGLASMLTGMSCVYLSQIRSAAVVLTIASVVLVAQLIPFAKLNQVGTLLLLGAVATVGGFQISSTLGGEHASDRLRSLLQADPGTVYQANRGMMLEYGFTTLLPQYPFGAGLAHWGMIMSYFGRAEDYIGAEIQIVGWILDGGFPLLLTYAAAVLVTVWAVAKQGFAHRHDAHGIWLSIVVAYDFSAMALCFSYPLFMGTLGLEFWLLNAVVLYSNPTLTGVKEAQPA